MPCGTINVEELIEKETEKLRNLNATILRAVQIRKNMDEDFEEARREHQKKLNFIRNIEESRLERIDNKKLEMKKYEDCPSTTHLQEKMKKELLEVNETTTNNRMDYEKQKIYLQEMKEKTYQNICSEKELIFLLEMAMTQVKDDKDTEAIVNAMKQLQQCTNLEKQNVKLQIQDMDKEQEHLMGDIQIKERLLASLKEKNSQLLAAIQEQTKN